MGTLVGEEKESRVYEESYTPRGERTISAQRVFKITTTSVAEGPRSILATPGLPLIWEPHPEDSSIYAKRARPRSQPGSTVWYVTVYYDDQNEINASSPATPPNADPTDNPPQIAYSTIQKSMIATSYWFDTGGGTYEERTLQNRAGGALPDTPSVNQAHGRIFYELNQKESDFSWEFWVGFLNTTNVAAHWTVAAPETLLFTDVTASQIRRQRISDDPDVFVEYRVISIVIEHEPLTHVFKARNAGEYALSQHNRTRGGQPSVAVEGRHDFFDYYGNPVIEDLDLNGDFNSGDPIFGDFSIWKPIDWTPLNTWLPTPF